jgi:hypothetical protein
MDILDPIEIPEETELQKKVKKIARFAISVFLIILMLNFLIPHDVINSIIEGKELKNYQISLKNTTILFDAATYEQLKQFYLSHQLTEFKVCLQGTIEDNTYKITSFYEPEIVFATPITVHAIRCDMSTIVDLHSHPFRNCVASAQDVMSKEKRINPSALSAIMCDIDRFAFY